MEQHHLQPKDISNLATQLRNSIERYERIGAKEDPLNIPLLLRHILQEEERDLEGFHSDLLLKKAVVEYWLDLLLSLQKALESAVLLKIPQLPSKPPPPPDLISLRDYTCIHSAIELLMRWAVHLCLDKAIGKKLRQRPLPKAIKIPLCLLNWDPESLGSDDASSASADKDMYVRTLHRIHKLLQMEQFMPMLSPRYLPDLFTGFLHLQNWEPEADDHPITINSMLERFPVRLCIASLRYLLTPGDQPCPQWLKRRCGGLLTQTLLQNGGLEATMDVYIGGAQDVENTAAIARLSGLLAAPSASLGPTEYLQKIGPQILSILEQPGQQRISILRVTAFLVGKLCEKMSEGTKELVLRPALLPFLLFQQETQSNCQEGQSPEHEMETCLSVLEKLVLATPPLPPLISALCDLDIFPALLRCYYQALVCKSYLLSSAEQTCLALLKRFPPKNCVQSLQKSVLPMPICGVFKLSEGGGLRLMTAGTHEPEPTSERSTLEELFNICGTNIGGIGELEEVQNRGAAAVKLLEKLDDDSCLAGDLFEALLSQYLDIKKSKQHIASKVRGETQTSLDVSIPQMALMVFVGIISEKLGPQVLRTGVQIISILEKVLTFEAEEFKEQDLRMVENDDGQTLSNEAGDIEPEAEEEGLLSLALSLLTTMLEMGVAERLPEEESALQTLLKPLRVLSLHRQPSIAEMAQSLQASLLTRDLSEEQRQQQKNREQKMQDEQLVSSEGLLSALKEATSDLESDVVPLRARGIVTLTKLIHRVPFKTLDITVADQFMSVYSQMLLDHESYVYLAAVQGISALASSLPGFCLPKLVKLFMGTEGCLEISQRIKVGEALMFAARKCGTAIPKYAHHFVDAFIVGARTRTSDIIDSYNSDKEKAGANKMEDSNCESKLANEQASQQCQDVINFRASCLSNLGEVCALLKWSLGTHAQNIFDVAIGILQLEFTAEKEAVSVRRGSLFIIFKILMSLNSSNFLQIIGTQITRTYRCLKFVCEHDNDDLCKYHANLSLETIDDFMRQSLLPGVSLESNNQNRGPPSSIFLEPTFPSFLKITENTDEDPR